MKKQLLLIIALLATTSTQAQFYSVNVNALSLLSGTINATAEISVHDKLSLNIGGYWNPIYTPKIQARIIAVQPGIRYWFWESFTGHFVASHFSYAKYSIGNRNYNYKGWLSGIGFSYGYA